MIGTFVFPVVDLFSYLDVRVVRFSGPIHSYGQGFSQNCLPGLLCTPINLGKAVLAEISLDAVSSGHSVLYVQPTCWLLPVSQSCPSLGPKKETRDPNKCVFRSKWTSRLSYLQLTC